MKKRILGCLTMLCVISVILTGCRNQRQGAADLQNRESSSLAMTEENAMNREAGAQDSGAPQGTGDSQGTGGSQDSEDWKGGSGQCKGGRRLLQLCKSKNPCRKADPCGFWKLELFLRIGTEIL